MDISSGSSTVEGLKFSNISGVEGTSGPKVVSFIKFCAVLIAVLNQLLNSVSLSGSNFLMTLRKSRLSSPSETAIISRMRASFSVLISSS